MCLGPNQAQVKVEERVAPLLVKERPVVVWQTTAPGIF